MQIGKLIAGEPIRKVINEQQTHNEIYNSMDELCDETLQQIEERDHTAVLRRYGFREIPTYGIPFRDKECTAKEKIISQTIFQAGTVSVPGSRRNPRSRVPPDCGRFCNTP